MIRRFQHILLILMIVWVPLAFFGRAADGFTLTKEIIALVVIGYFFMCLAWQGRWLLHGALFQTILLFMFWMFLDSLVVGSLKLEVLKGSIHLILMVGTLLAVAYTCSQGLSYEKLTRFILLVGAFLALYGIIQSLGLDRANWTTHFEHRAFATLGNPDYLGGYLAALLPMAFLLLLRDFGRKTAWLWLNAVLLMAAGLFATRVRGAEMAAFAGFLCLAVLFLGTTSGRELAQRNKLLLKVSLALALSLGAIWVALHWKSFSRPQPSVVQRLETYQVAWEMIKAHPWFGIGVGQLGFHYPLYQSKPWNAQDYPLHPYTYTEHVHNEFLQFWVEGGLPGLLLFLAVLLVFGLILKRFLSNPLVPENEKVLGMGATAGLTALLIQSLSNFPLQVAPTAILFGFFLAAPLCMNKAVLQSPSPIAMSFTQKILTALVVLVIALTGLRALASSIVFRDTVGESSFGNGKLAAYYGNRLVWLSPLNPKAWNAYGKALELAGHPDQAYQAYEKSVEFNPNDVESLNAMADIRVQQNRFAEAVESCQKAEVIAPNYSAPLWPLAVSLFELKRYQESANAFERNLAYTPNDFQTLLDLGVCYIQLKRKADAFDVWKKAYALNSHDPQLVQYLKSQGFHP